jgi:hypothetical protein
LVGRRKRPLRTQLHLKPCVSFYLGFHIGEERRTEYDTLPFNLPSIRQGAHQTPPQFAYFANCGRVCTISISINSQVERFSLLRFETTQYYTDPTYTILVHHISRHRKYTIPVWQFDIHKFAPLAHYAGSRSTSQESPVHKIAPAHHACSMCAGTTLPSMS